MDTTLNDKDFSKISDFIHKLCGIKIKEDKKYLIQNRLKPFLEDNNFESFEKLALGLLFLDENQKKSIVDKITTNETSFFRDKHPFQSLGNVILPELYKRFDEQNSASKFQMFNKKINIWSLASSTGQEAFSIAFTLQEFCKTYRGACYDNFSILGSDICEYVLERARSGEYTDHELKRGLLKDQVAAFFDPGTPFSYKVKKEVSSIVSFEFINVIENFPSTIKKFDLIFCRNMLIYFDLETKAKVLDQIYNAMKPGAYLLVGASENLIGMSTNFEKIKIGNTTFYKK